MCKCKFCKSDICIKYGKARGEQRYKCKICEKTFIRGDKRVIRNEVAENLAIVLYSTGKASYRFIGKLLGISYFAVYKWIKDCAEKYGEVKIRQEVREIEIDEMWHFIQKKVTSAGYLRQWIEEQENVLRMLLDKETFKQYINSMKS
jgi:transposase-like protein